MPIFPTCVKNVWVQALYNWLSNLLDGCCRKISAIHAPSKSFRAHPAAEILSSHLPYTRPSTDGAGLEFVGTWNAGLEGSVPQQQGIRSAP